MNELLSMNLVEVGVLPIKLLNGHLFRLSESQDLSLCTQFKQLKSH